MIFLNLLRDAEDLGGPTLLEVRWRMRGPLPGVLYCAIFRDAAGREVRVGFRRNEPLRTALVAALGDARVLAAVWRYEILTNSNFVEVPTL